MTRSSIEIVARMLNLRKQRLQESGFDERLQNCCYFLDAEKADLNTDVL